MGNCLRLESAMQWGGDDWGSPLPRGGTNFAASNTRQLHGTELDKVGESQEEEVLLGRGKAGFISSSNSTVSNKASRTEIKIKITRKQLEELLASVDIKELSVQQVLAHLINVGHDKISTQTTSVRSSTGWRPNLQSIPE